MRAANSLLIAGPQALSAAEGRGSVALAMRAAAGLPLLVAAAALLVTSLFFADGLSDGRLYWIGAGAVAVCLVGLAGGLLGWLPEPAPTRTGLAAIGLLAAFTLWLGLTIRWSVTPDESWASLNRGIVYLAFAVVGICVAALVRRPLPVVADALALLLGAVAVWALAGKVIPALFPDGARVARLRSPIGYWNALALACAISLPLYLRLATRRRRLACLGVYVGVVALLLTYSRGGLLAAVAALALWLALGATRGESVRVLAVAVPAGLAVAGTGLALPGVAKDLQPHHVRVEDGAWFGLALVVGACLVAWLGGRELGRRELRGLGALACCLVAVGVGALAARGDWLAGFRCSDAELPQGAQRLGCASSNNRFTWWEEAWRLFSEQPLAGTGAGSFGVARQPIRDSPVPTTEPHNVALQFLAETGVVGVLLGAAAAIAGLAASWETVRRLEGDERAAGLALACVLPIYLLHALADIDWDFVAITAPVCLVVGVLIGAVGPPREHRRRPAFAGAAIVGAVCLAALYSLTAPWLANRSVDDAYAALDEGDAPAAVAAARDAHDLNPLSIDAVLALALADESAGDEAAALARLEERTRMQPENSDTWYELGAYEYRLHRYQDCYRDLNQAYTLDPYASWVVPGGLLDRCREKVNAGAR